jgi:phosphoglycolate phosphatase-like HAD superfamily hydrolase
MAILILWDIDGTLLHGGRVVADAFDQALREIYELQELQGALATTEHGGKTDPQIALEVLQLHNIAEAAALERIERFHGHYLGLVTAAYEQLKEGVRVLPGVEVALQALAEAGAIQSTLTGNLRGTAELKLRATGLLPYFDLRVGAFGSDHRNRDELVAVARQRALAHYGTPDDIVVVGDTPRDIACGKAGGARTVAVATGNWSRDDLARHEPDALLDDLQRSDQALAAILNR